MEWKHEGNPVPVELVDDLERRLGLKLPLEYRDWLLVRDGAVPVACEFGVDGHPEAFFDVQIFFGINRPEKGSNLGWAADVYADLVAKGWFPIASTGTGDVVLLGVSEDKYGGIAFYDSLAEGDGIWSVGTSFSRFLASLREPTDE